MEKPSRMRVKPEPAPLRRTRFPRGGSVGQRASAATSPTSPQGCETDVHEGQALGRVFPCLGAVFADKSAGSNPADHSSNPCLRWRRLAQPVRRMVLEDYATGLEIHCPGASFGFRNPSALRNSQVQERKLLDARHWMYAVDDGAEINFFKVGSRDVTSRPSIPDSLASNRLKDANTIRAHSGNSRDRSSADP